MELSLSQYLIPATGLKHNARAHPSPGYTFLNT